MGWGASLGGALGSFFGPFGTLVGAGLGGLTESAVNTTSQQYYGKTNAKTAYERSLYMSNSAHQREVADLKAAGLNPVLSVLGNGASTVSVPASTTPSFHDNTNYGDTITQANSAQSQRRMQESLAEIEIENKLKEGDLLDSSIDKNQADTLRSLADVDNLASQTSVHYSQARKNAAETWLWLEKQKWFKALPDAQKYDVISSMMYPTNKYGVIRGLLNRTLHGIKDIHDIGTSNGGFSSANDVKQYGPVKDSRRYKNLPVNQGRGLGQYLKQGVH